MFSLIRTSAFFAWMLFSLSGLAAALVETATGNVRAGATVGAATAVSKGQRIQPGSVVVTGPGGLTILRFDDGQAVALNENSEFRITEYSFAKDDPKKDRSIFDLLKGAMRSVSGLLASRNAQAYATRIPQGTIGIRGTDFMVAVVNPAYMSVLNGTIAVSNTAGTVTFGAGATATVASATTLATAIAASALPASVAASFNQLGSLPIAGAGAATGAAAGGVTVGAVGIAAAIVGVAVAISSDDDSTTTTTTTTTTTSTP